jgi:hypothetical protein
MSCPHPLVIMGLSNVEFQFTGFNCIMCWICYNVLVYTAVTIFRTNKAEEDVARYTYIATGVGVGWCYLVGRGQSLIQESHSESTGGGEQHLNSLVVVKHGSATSYFWDSLHFKIQIPYHNKVFLLMWCWVLFYCISVSTEDFGVKDRRKETTRKT